MAYHEILDAKLVLALNQEVSLEGAKEIVEQTEDEVTIMDSDQYSLVEQLQVKGAELVLDNATIEDYYFDYPINGNNKDGILEGLGFRIRIRKVTEKGAEKYRVDIKTGHQDEEGNTFQDNKFGERTTTFSNWEDAYKELQKELEILKIERPGLFNGNKTIRIEDCKVRYRKKRRTSYLIDGVKFDFDDFIEQGGIWRSLKNGNEEGIKGGKLEKLHKFMRTFVEVEILYHDGSIEEELLKQRREELLTEFGVPKGEKVRRVEDFNRIQYCRDNPKP